MKDDVNIRLSDLFAKADDTEEKLQGLQLEYEGLRREVETLKYARQTLSEDVNNTVKILGEIEQCSRRDCLIFTGIKEGPDPSREDTDEVVINICNAKLGLNIAEDSIDRSHRLGLWHPITAQSQTEFETPKPRAIIVKSMNYHDRSIVSHRKTNRYCDIRKPDKPKASTAECCQRNRWCQKCLVTRWKSLCNDRWQKSEAS